MYFIKQRGNEPKNSDHRIPLEGRQNSWIRMEYKDGLHGIHSYIRNGS